MRTITLLVAALFFSAANGFGETLTIASTTSLEDSGFLAYALPHFTATKGGKVRVIVAGSGEALRLLKAGDAELALVHYPRAESEFLRRFAGAVKTPIMASRFVIVGPAADPCDVKRATTAVGAFVGLSQGCGKFVSRGDASGTHGKELQLWRDADFEVTGGHRWYLSIGGGMGEALRIATEIDGYLLIDIATWLNLRQENDKENGGLRVLFDKSGSAAMVNPYSALRVGNSEPAEELINWFKSSSAIALIKAFRLKSEAVFTAPN